MMSNCRGMKTLPNGAIELGRKRVSPSREVVLGVWGKGEENEFVTWNMFYGAQLLMGHYYPDIKPAMEDFFNRR